MGVTAQLKKKEPNSKAGGHEEGGPGAITFHGLRDELKEQYKEHGPGGEGQEGGEKRGGRRAHKEPNQPAQHSGDAGQSGQGHGLDRLAAAAVEGGGNAHALRKVV